MKAGYGANKHHRRSFRLHGFDYTREGAYFVTACTQDRTCLFGDMVKGEVRLNDAGQIVADEWARTAEVRHEIELDAFVIMPNHLHAIVWIVDGRGDRPVAPTPVVTTLAGPRPKSIGALMAGFKSAVTKRINQQRRTSGVPVWQRNYFEHIIRDDAALNCIRQYITENPARWAEDPENPVNAGATPVGATGRSPLHPDRKHP